MTKKKEFKTGDVIKLTPKQIKVVQTINTQLNIAKTAFNLASEKYHDIEDDLWLTIKEFYPEVIDNFTVSLLWGDFELVIRKEYTDQDKKILQAQREWIKRHGEKVY